MPDQPHGGRQELQPGKKMDSTTDKNPMSTATVYSLLKATTRSLRRPKCVFVSTAPAPSHSSHYVDRNAAVGILKDEIGFQGGCGRAGDRAAVRVAHEGEAALQDTRGAE